MIYAGICDRMSQMFIASRKKLAINKQIFAVFEVLGDSYGSRNANRWTETEAAKLILIR